jgi:ribosomal protein S18 acetylase RimI-like enzyme
MSSKGTKRKATTVAEAEAKKPKSPEKQAPKIEVIPANDILLWNLLRRLQEEYKRKWQEEHNNSSPEDPLPDFVSSWHTIDRLWEARRNGFLLICIDGSALPAVPSSRSTRVNFPLWNMPILGFIAATVSTDDSFVYVVSTETFSEYRHTGVGRALFNALEALSMERKQRLTNVEIERYGDSARPERILNRILLDPAEGSESFWRNMGFTQEEADDTCYSRPLVLPTLT